MHHERLKRARESKGWSIEELVRRTGIRAKTIELVERGAFAELPAGLYSRSTIRTYASAVGLDPSEMLDVLGPLLPVPEDALDGLARLRGHARKPDGRSHDAVASTPAPPAPRAAPASLPRSLERVSATIFDFPERITASTTDSVEANDEVTVVGVGSGLPDLDDTIAEATLRSEAPEMHDLSLMELDASTAEPAAAVGLELPDAELTDAMRIEPEVRAGREWWRPVVASTIDGTLLALLGGALVWLTAQACGTSVPVALRIAGPAIALVFALIVGLYFVIFGGLGNATLGVYLMRVDALRGFAHIDDSLIAD